MIKSTSPPGSRKPHPTTLVTATVLCAFLLSGCSKLIETTPDPVTDTSDLTITFDATKGNKGLMDYSGDVYVHVGLITNKSEHKDDWRYVKFAWGSRDSLARATPVGNNKWEYTIGNIREFFDVEENEKVNKLAILFRSGACIDVHCKVLRNEDESNIFIPILDQSAVNAQK
jgi:hypothetical protein